MKDNKLKASSKNAKPKVKLPKKASGVKKPSKRKPAVKKVILDRPSRTAVEVIADPPQLVAKVVDEIEITQVCCGNPSECGGGDISSAKFEPKDWTAEFRELSQSGRIPDGKPFVKSLWDAICKNISDIFE